MGKYNKGPRKGRKNEIKLAHNIGVWWCNDPDAFWHTHGSGGWKKAKTGRVHPGDIAPVKPGVDFCAVIEAKHDERWTLDALFMEKEDAGRLWRWWQKLKKDMLMGLTPLFLPMLIFRRNFFPELIMVPGQFTLPKVDGVHMVLKKNGEWVQIVYAEEFFKKVPATMVTEWVKKRFPILSHPNCRCVLRRPAGMGQ